MQCYKKQKNYVTLFVARLLAFHDYSFFKLLVAFRKTSSDFYMFF